MRRTWIFITLLRLSLFPVMMVAAGDFEIRRRHGNGLLGRRAAAAAVPMVLEKRFDSARFTFYDAGLGACGITNSNSDFIVALNIAQWSSGATTANCFKTITITANGKTANAQITDLCPGCPYGGLDFSRGLFDYFADESVGVLTGSWVFGGSTPATPTTSTTPYTPPTTTYYNANPIPTTTSSDVVYNNSPSSTHSPSPSSSSFSSHSSSSAFSVLSSSSTSSAPGATPSGNTTSSTTMGVLEGMNLAFVNMGALFVSGNKVDR